VYIHSLHRSPGNTYVIALAAWLLALGSWKFTLSLFHSSTYLRHKTRNGASTGYEVWRWWTVAGIYALEPGCGGCRVVGLSEVPEFRSPESVYIPKPKPMLLVRARAAGFI
jgi:hypothetical protein